MLNDLNGYFQATQFQIASTSQLKGCVVFANLNHLGSDVYLTELMHPESKVAFGFFELFIA